MNLRQNFSGRAATAGVAAALVFAPLGGATAQDAQPQQQAEFTRTATTNVNLSRDAGREAYQWSTRNSGIAVAVRLGRESQVTPVQIEQILTREIQSAGVSTVVFFYDQNDTAGTGVSYSFAGNTDGPFSLGEARPAAARSAQQYLYQRSNGLAYNSGL